MSGRLRMRVGTLEGRVKAEGACRVCGGKPRLKILMGEEEPLPEPCHRCGRHWKVIRIIRETPPEGWEERPKNGTGA